MKPDFEKLKEAAMLKVREIHAQREEILTAFIAKYGFGPERIVQVIKNNDDGTQEYWVRHKTEEEMIAAAYESGALGTPSTDGIHE